MMWLWTIGLISGVAIALAGGMLARRYFNGRRLERALLSGRLDALSDPRHAALVEWFRDPVRSAQKDLFVFILLNHGCRSAKVAQAVLDCQASAQNGASFGGLLAFRVEEMFPPGRLTGPEFALLSEAELRAKRREMVHGLQRRIIEIEEAGPSHDGASTYM
jgi:hypothetical protein